MCGRYVRRGDKQKLAEHFRAQLNPPDLPLPDADYNVAPTTYQPIVRQSRERGGRELVLARWGLVPFFTKDLKDIKGLSTIKQQKELGRMYGTGQYTISDLAELFSISRPTVYRTLLRENDQI